MVERSASSAGFVGSIESFQSKVFGLELDTQMFEKSVLDLETEVSIVKRADPLEQPKRRRLS